MRGFALIIGTFLCLLSLDGCGGKDSASYRPCVKDGDCQASEICEQQQCQPATACVADQDCLREQICEQNFCKAAQCIQDDQCEAKHHCEALRCVADPLPECETDAQCTTNFCDNGTCKVRPCTQDQDCLNPQQLCLENTCQARPACQTDQECPTGTVCEAGSCVRSCAVVNNCQSATEKCQGGHCLTKCASDAGCTGGKICEGGVCVLAECQNPQDCTGTYVRCLLGRCETYTPCDPAECQDANFICIDHICEELPICQDSSTCETTEACLDGHCHVICRGPEDCPGEVCLDGRCQAGGDPLDATQVVILPQGGQIKTGQTVQLTAQAFNQAGQEVAGVAFDWSSSVPQNAAIDQTGLLTGGSLSGDTQVTAKVQGSSVISDSVVFTNFTVEPNDKVRVVVVDEATRAPLAAIKVMYVTTGPPATVTEETDANGTVLFTPSANPADVHVFSDNHNYLSVLQTISTDLLLPISARPQNPPRVGGFVGQMDIPDTTGMTVGWAGANMPGLILDREVLDFMGTPYVLTLTIPGNPMEISVPSPLVMDVTVMGFNLAQKQDYYVTGPAGIGPAWCLGGAMNPQAFMQVINDMSNIENLLLALLPSFQNFQHGMNPMIEIIPRPMVADANDFNNNGDVDELVPDWANFPQVPLAADHPQLLSVNLAPPKLPTFNGSEIRTTLLMTGVRSPSGFTTLGMTAEEAVVGQPPPLTMKMTPPYNGLEQFNYVVTVSGMPYSSTDNSYYMAATTLLYQGKQLPVDLAFESGFLAFMEDATYTQGTRSLVATGVDGANLVRVGIYGEAGAWKIYLPSSQTINFTLPQPPSGMADLANYDSIYAVPIKLTAGVTYEEVIGFDGQGLGAMDQKTVAYSASQITVAK